MGHSASACEPGVRRRLRYSTTPSPRCRRPLPGWRLRTRPTKSTISFRNIALRNVRNAAFELHFELRACALAAASPQGNVEVALQEEISHKRHKKHKRVRPSFLCFLHLLWLDFLRLNQRHCRLRRILRRIPAPV